MTVKRQFNAKAYDTMDAWSNYSGRQRTFRLFGLRAYGRIMGYTNLATM